MSQSSEVRLSVLASFGNGQPFIFGEVIYYRRREAASVNRKIPKGVPANFYYHSLFVKRNGELINITNDFGRLRDHNVPCGDEYCTNRVLSEDLIKILGDKVFLDYNAFKAEAL